MTHDGYGGHVDYELSDELVMMCAMDTFTDFLEETHTGYINGVASIGFYEFHHENQLEIES